MMSHCTASLKLTPWHEGTFASSVIYSPPPTSPLSPSLPSSCLQTLRPLPPSRSCLKMRNDIDFIVKQDSFFSCSPGTVRKRGREKMEHRKGKSQLCQVSLRQLELFCLWPAAPVENGSVLHYGNRNVTHLWGNAAVSMRLNPLGQGRQKASPVNVSVRSQPDPVRRAESWSAQICWGDETQLDKQKLLFEINQNWEFNSENEVKIAWMLNLDYFVLSKYFF